MALVLPVRNEAAALPELFAALDNALAWPAEIVFSDAGSTDGTSDVIHTWWRGAARAGVALQVLDRPGALPGGGRNAGIAAAHAEWIAFLDGGIRPEPGWLAALHAAALAGGRDHAFGLCRFDAHGAVALSVCALTNGVGSSATVLPAAVFHRRVFARVGVFEEQLRSAEDLLWLRKFTDAYGAREVCTGALVHYTHYPNSLLAIFRKWFAFERSSVAAKVGGAMRLAYAAAGAIALFLTVTAPSLAAAAFAFYLVLRGIADPIRRSRNALWWRAFPAALMLAPVCALAIDSGKLCGALAGWCGWPPQRVPAG